MRPRSNSGKSMVTFEADIAAFAENVARLRREKKLSQTEVANRSGIHATEVSRIERGLRDPRLSTLIRLARALEVDPNRLLDGYEPWQRTNSKHAPITCSQ